MVGEGVDLFGDRRVGHDHVLLDHLHHRQVLVRRNRRRGDGLLFDLLDLPISVGRIGLDHRPAQVKVHLRRVQLKCTPLLPLPPRIHRDRHHLGQHFADRGHAAWPKHPVRFFGIFTLLFTIDDCLGSLVAPLPRRPQNRAPKPGISCHPPNTLFVLKVPDH